MAAHFKSDFAAQAVTLDHCPSRSIYSGRTLRRAHADFQYARKGVRGRLWPRLVVSGSAAMRPLSWIAGPWAAKAGTAALDPEPSFSRMYKSNRIEQTPEGHARRVWPS
jgi:hypothetical protein